MLCVLLIVFDFGESHEFNPFTLVACSRDEHVFFVVGIFVVITRSQRRDQVVSQTKSLCGNETARWCVALRLEITMVVDNTVVFSSMLVIPFDADP